jgi:hypothetical protein
MMNGNNGSWFGFEVSDFIVALASLSLIAGCVAETPLLKRLNFVRALYKYKNRQSQ